MGIYAEEGKTKEIAVGTDGTVTWVETSSTPGVTRSRRIIALPWQEERTDCFCCSCGWVGGSDMFCRNHGFAGERPCEVHGLPGQEDEDGVMPDSVQHERARHTP